MASAASGQREPENCGEVARAVADPRARLIIVQADIQTPMQAVLELPVAAHRVRKAAATAGSASAVTLSPPDSVKLVR